MENNSKTQYMKYFLQHKMQIVGQESIEIHLVGTLSNSVPNRVFTSVFK